MKIVQAEMMKTKIDKVFHKSWAAAAAADVIPVW